MLKNYYSFYPQINGKPLKCFKHGDWSCVSDLWLQCRGWIGGWRGSGMGMGSLLYLNDCNNVLNPKSQWLDTENTTLCHAELRGVRHPSSVLKCDHQGHLVRGRQGLKITVKEPGLEVICHCVYLLLSRTPWLPAELARKAGECSLPVCSWGGSSVVYT